MIPIKIECNCGQKYAFEIEPLDGRMPSRVSCPVCGADGNAAAIEQITLHSAVLSGAQPELAKKTPLDGRPGLGVRFACSLAVVALIFGGGGWWWMRTPRLQATPASAATTVAAGPGLPAAPAGVASAASRTDTIAAPEDGFVNLFNGHDLSGWSGDPQIWLVKDGVITGKASAKKGEGSFLVWTNGTVGDFELRFSFRVPRANSGIAYRAKDFGNWTLFGYQYVIT